jgi:hypothetical protein
MKCALKKGELFRLEGGNGGTVLRCLAGALWITTGDGRDYLLTDSRTLQASPGKTALVEALQDTEIRLEEAAASIAAIRQLPGRVLRFMAAG